MAVISISTKFSKEKDPTLHSKIEIPYLNPDGEIHVPSMQMDFDYFKRMGCYTGKLDLPQIIHPQFTDHVVQQLGPCR